MIDFIKNLPPDITTFLTYIATPTVLGPILSELLEYLPWYQNLPTSFMRLTVLFIIMVAVGILSYALVNWVPQGIFDQLKPIYSIIVASAAFFISSQLYHNKTTGDTGKTTTAIDIKAQTVTSDGSSSKIVEPSAATVAATKEPEPATGKG